MGSEVKHGLKDLKEISHLWAWSWSYSTSMVCWLTPG